MSPFPPGNLYEHSVHQGCHRDGWGAGNEEQWTHTTHRGAFDLGESSRAMTNETPTQSYKYLQPQLTVDHQLHTSIITTLLFQQVNVLQEDHGQTDFVLHIKNPIYLSYIYISLIMFVFVFVCLNI